MRCKNCGWENPDGKTNCEKCHGSLGDDAIASSHKPTMPSSDRMKSTVAESAVFGGPSPGAVPKTCPKCGYPVSDDSTVCPNCDHELQQPPTLKQGVRCKSCGADIAADANFCPSCGHPANGQSPVPRHIPRPATGTVMGGPVSGPGQANKFCTLRPVAWEGEDIDYNPVTYTGDVIILNRSNTDPNNNTITSKEQAALTFEDGGWYIENRSELRTTFIRVGGKVRLNSGDIIVLGNREFEFKG